MDSEKILLGDNAENLIAGYATYATAEELEADMADQAPANTPSVVVTSTIAWGC
ncbi:MAG TPA: LxmA leader domain family RiPP [Streptomyces sp.]|nr:LxmA leader domain family RiPP [Streptomyces sp.]